MTSQEIKNIRKDLGLSQEKFANKIGVSVSALRAWEQGRSKVTSLPYIKAIRDVALTQKDNYKEITLKGGESITIRGV